MGECPQPICDTHRPCPTIRTVVDMLRTYPTTLNTLGTNIRPKKHSWPVISICHAYLPTTFSNPLTTRSVGVVPTEALCAANVIFERKGSCRAPFQGCVIPIGPSFACLGSYRARAHRDGKLDPMCSSVGGLFRSIMTRITMIESKNLG